MAVAQSAAELIFSARGDTDHARKEFKDFKKEVKELKDEARETGGGFDKLAHSAGLSASQFSSLTSIATGAVAGIAAITAVAIGASLALFNLSRNTAEFGSSIFDASQQTGQGTETMSALKVAAEQSGSSFESITDKVAKFNVLLGQANAGNAKAEKTLRDYGITARDTERALIQAVARIAEMTTHEEKAAAAGALFKDRTGEILPVIKSFDGDLPGLINKLREMGVLLSEEDAKAADEFGDQLDMLSLQLASAGRAIGFAFMPIFNEMARNVSEFLTNNKDEIRTWADNTVTFLFGVRSAWNDLIARVKDYKTRAEEALNIKIPEGQPSTFTRDPNNIFFQYGKRLGENIKARGEARPLPAQMGSQIEIVSLAGEDEEAKREREKRDKERLAANERLNKAQKESIEQAYAELKEITKKHYEDRLITAEVFNGQFIENERQFTARLIQLTQESFARQAAAAKNQTERKAIEIEERTAIEKINEDSRKRLEAATDLTTKTEKRAADDRVKINEDAAKKEIAVLKAISETQLAILKERRDLGEITAREMIRMAGLERKSILESTLARTSDATQRKIIQEEINQQVIKNREDLRNYDKEEKERHENAKKRWADYIRHLEDVKEREDELEQRRAEAAERARIAEEQAAFDQIGGGLLGGMFRELGLTVEQMAAPMNILNGLGQMLGATFQQLAAGVGQAVKAFVLFGNSGTSFRKIAAEMIASIAQMAAVQALWELAQWAAMTALFYFTGNPKFALAAGAHLTAAIIYGGIAAIAAVVGRAVAGNSFKSETSGAFGSAPGGAQNGQNRDTSGQGKQYSSFGDEVTIVESGINRAAPAARVTLDIRPTDAFIVEVVKEDINNNGVLRTTVQDA